MFSTFAVMTIQLSFTICWWTASVTILTASVTILWSLRKLAAFTGGISSGWWFQPARKICASDPTKHLFILGETKHLWNHQLVIQYIPVFVHARADAPHLEVAGPGSIQSCLWVPYGTYVVPMWDVLHLNDAATLPPLSLGRSACQVTCYADFPSNIANQNSLWIIRQHRPYGPLVMNHH